jgi:hypothetical protein
MTAYATFRSAEPSTRRRNSAPWIENSTNPQSKQTTSCGNTITWGVVRSFSPLNANLVYEVVFLATVRSPLGIEFKLCLALLLGAGNRNGVGWLRRRVFPKRCFDTQWGFKLNARLGSQLGHTLEFQRRTSPESARSESTRHTRAARPYRSIWLWRSTDTSGSGEAPDK